MRFQVDALGGVTRVVITGCDGIDPRFRLADGIGKGIGVMAESGFLLLCSRIKAPDVEFTQIGGSFGTKAKYRGNSLDSTLCTRASFHTACIVLLFLKVSVQLQIRFRWATRPAYSISKSKRASSDSERADLPDGPDVPGCRLLDDSGKPVNPPPAMLGTEGYSTLEGVSHEKVML